MFKDSKWRKIVDNNIFDRKSYEYLIWEQLVKERVNNKCCVCGDDIDIEVHHIIPFSDNYEKRIDVNNGICLCKRHHSSKISGSFHNVYGTVNNTYEQLQQYINDKRYEIGLPKVMLEELLC